MTFPSSGQSIPEDLHASSGKLSRDVQRAFRVFKEWRYKSKKYGTISGTARVVCRFVPRLWPPIGKAVTASYLRRWTNAPGPKVINLGGQAHLKDEWLSADIHPQADVYVDCCKTFPWADHSIDAIMLEEVIEHFNYRDGLHVLKECRRILKDDGVLRVSTPDFFWFAQLPVVSGSNDEDRKRWEFVKREGLLFLNCGNAPESAISMAALNQIFLCHSHRFIYTAQALEDQFKQAGLRAQRSTYQDPNSRLGGMDSHADRFFHPPEMSLFYDAWRM
jgi:predicted SAM-dependent methyltransferase